MFDPSQHKPAQYDDSALPPGVYLLQLDSVELKIGKDSRRPYVRGQYKVISGPMKGRGFFSSLGIDLSMDGTAGRLSAFCAAAGISGAVDLQSEESIKRTWCHRPFKAEITQKQNGQYTNNDIKKYAMDAKSITKEERNLIAAWRAEFVQAQQFKGTSDSFGDGFDGDLPESGNEDEENDDDSDEIPF